MNRIEEDFQRVDSNGSLSALLSQLTERKLRQEDIVAPTTQMQFRTTCPYLPHHDSAYKGPVAENISEIIIEANGGVPTQIAALNGVAFDQLMQKSGIATRDGRRFQDEYPEQFDSLVNAILVKEPARRILRAYNTDANNYLLGRAIVSDAFKTFDNYDLLEAALPPLLDNTEAQWRTVNALVTDRKMYLRLRAANFEGMGAAVGDLMAAGIFLSNSEVGLGAVTAGFMVFTLACLNGMQTGQVQRSAHIQSARGSDAYGILQADTKEADNYATALKMRDYVAEYSSRDNFDRTLEKFRAAANDTVENGTAAVEALGGVLKLSQTETSSVLDGLLATAGQAGYAGKPISRATLVNAVTACANKADPDKVDEWQRLGGRVLELGKSEWEKVALAA